MVPRRLRLVTCREDSGCPNNGSKINGRDRASTASSSPSVNSVPIRLPSLPSRAISTASPISGSSTSGSYSVTSQRRLSNIHRAPDLRITQRTFGRLIGLCFFPSGECSQKTFDNNIQHWNKEQVKDSGK